MQTLDITVVVYVLDDEYESMIIHGEFSDRQLKEIVILEQGDEIEFIKAVRL